jgi:DNA polymerase-4
VTRTLLYAEVCDFYAAVERAADPALAQRPVIVGGDPRKRGVVQSATEDARAAGVVAGMQMLEALERCPRARALRTRMPFYREAALKLRACLRRVVESLEPDGFEAAFLDATDGNEAPEALAERLRERAAVEVGLPLRVGLAPMRNLARLAAREAGASGIRVVRHGEESEFLNPLPLSRLPFLGPNAELRLAQAGARTVGEALALPPERLEQILGNRARELIELAGGRGDARVKAEKQPRSLGQETTLEVPERSEEALREELGRISASLENMLRLQGLGARRITLKVRYDDLQTVTRSQTLVRALSQGLEIEAAARDLLARTDAGTRPVRLLGVILGRLGRSRRDPRQLDLFSPSR